MNNIEWTKDENNDNKTRNDIKIVVSRDLAADSKIRIMSIDLTFTNQIRRPVQINLRKLFGLKSQNNHEGNS